MNEERIKELFSNEEYVNGLFELDSYEAAAAKLQEDGVEVSAEELRKTMQLLQKKQDGELSDEELEDVAGGFGIVLLLGPMALGIMTIQAVSGGVRKIKKKKGC